MKIFFVLLSVFILNSSLSAYSTKIIIGTFKSDKNAQRLISRLPSLISNYDELKQLLKKDDVIIHIRNINNYHLVVAEIFLNEEIAEKSLKIIKKRFKYAYMNEAPSEEYLVQKAKEIQKLEKEVVKLKKPKITNKNLEVKKEKNYWQDALEYVNFTFLIIFIIIMSLIYLFMIYKEKYDEY